MKKIFYLISLFFSMSTALHAMTDEEKGYAINREVERRDSGFGGHDAGNPGGRYRPFSQQIPARQKTAQSDTGRFHPLRFRHSRQRLMDYFRRADHGIFPVRVFQFQNQQRNGRAHFNHLRFGFVRRIPVASPAATDLGVMEKPLGQIFPACHH